ncbi:hypothetical protein MTBLM5_190001 [Magnetospirillum sp. LM-5]|nr:hypothetical protein MTBLM5_190001 [Magnetospirillum sp. LM-5]
MVSFFGCPSPGGRIRALGRSLNARRSAVPHYGGSALQSRSMVNRLAETTTPCLSKRPKRGAALKDKQGVSKFCPGPYRIARVQALSASASTD